jgi:hypothetical protein
MEGKIILKQMLNEYGGRMWADFICLKIGTSGLNFHVPQKAANFLIN